MMLNLYPYNNGHLMIVPYRHLGAVTQGTTEEDALKNIEEVVQMIVAELREDGLPLPDTSDDIEVFEGTRVAVTV